jgi:uncharacterized membrane protein YhhN
MNRLGFLSTMNPTLRGFLIILAIAGVITALSLEPTLTALFFIVRIAFFLAIAFFIYLVWRERREEIAAWPARPRAVLYGGALLAVVNLGLAFAIDYPDGGLEIVIFIAVLVACAFSMWRVWRDQTTYSYY